MRAGASMMAAFGVEQIRRHLTAYGPDKNIHIRRVASRIAPDALIVLWVKFFVKIINLPYVFSPIKRGL